MKLKNNETNPSFYVIGISYKKADAKLRGNFSLSPTKKANLLKQAKTSGIQGLLATSTCNRTEIYGLVEHPSKLIQLLCQNTKGSVETFEQVGYVLKDSQAIEHIFRVGAGLDSQILGDFEIISQLKVSAKISKTYNLMDNYLERLVNCVLQASKRIKNETELSSGATSVSFASVQYILNAVKDIKAKNILLFGTGKIGRNTCKNLIKHTKNEHITLINRTRESAEKLAGKFKVHVKNYSQLQEEIAKADILIVATGAQNPTIDKQLIVQKKELLILDLSIPKNVDENVKTLANVTLTHLDELSGITDNTLQKRKRHIPMAEAIIKAIKEDFEVWVEYRKFAPTIKALKEKLKVFADVEIKNQRKKNAGFNYDQADLISSNIVQKITNHFAHHLKEEAVSSKESLALIHKIFQLEA
jgi:glutamyl-tRNA reductase|tara:strand:+ start:3478 stop:4725 length:1248 start_codon:yes stop_codon:yes gene_type:complete